MGVEWALYPIRLPSEPFRVSAQDVRHVALSHHCCLTWGHRVGFSGSQVDTVSSHGTWQRPPVFRKPCGPITGARSQGVLSGPAIYLRSRLGIVSVCARVCLHVSRAVRVCMRVRSECWSFVLEFHELLHVDSARAFAFEIINE